MRYGVRSRHPRARRLAPTLLLCGLLALAAAGTALAAIRADASRQASDTLVLANAVKIDTLDPANNSVNESIWIDQNIWNRLIQPNATGTGLLPDLAASWSVSKNGLVYTFHLRKASFSDGSPITAEDVRYSIDRSMKY
jgi:ABC-type transport system substrate-binding protein